MNFPYLLKLKRKFFFHLVLIIPLMIFSGCSKKSHIKPPPPNVKTATVEQRDVPIYLDTIGQAIPPVTVQVTPQVGGKLLAVFVAQGAEVKKGDLLYTIDPRPFEAALDQARAQLVKDVAALEYAKKTLARNREILKDQFVSLLNFEQYQSNVASAEAQVEYDRAAIVAAALNLEFCTIVAPVSGKISYFNIDVGNVVTQNDTTAITTIRPSSPIDVMFSLPQQYFELIRKDQGDTGPWKYVAILPEEPKTLYHGDTFFIDNQLNQDTGTILLKGRLANSEKALWPGAFLKVKVLQKIAPDAFVVPLGAVLIGKNGPYVYVVDKDGKAQSFDVQVLTRTDDYIAFQSDKINKGDTVITDGQINVAPGVQVHVLEDSKNRTSKS